jgi:hypothetical protein
MDLKMDDIAETERLRATAQKMRLKTIATELNLAFTWCSVARTEGEMGELNHFRISLQRIKSATASLQRRISDPAHVDPHLRSEFNSELEKLEVKIKDLQSRFGG